MATILTSGAGAQTQPAPAKKVLVAYYSHSGNTREVARQIAGVSGGELFEIVPVTPYPSAPPVATFLTSYDFAGKTVVPFMTHEGSRMGRSEEDIRKLCPKSQVPDGLPVRGGAVGSSKDAVEKWVRARLKSGL